jgi:transcriptional regulator with XRE-family HTH domain
MVKCRNTAQNHAPHDPTPLSIGDRIRQVRTDLNLTQRRFADLVGVDPGAVSRWERGISVPEHSRILLIANESGRPVSWFYAGENVNGSTVNEQLERMHQRIDRIEEDFAALRALALRTKRAGT